MTRPSRQVNPTDIPGVVLVTPQVFADPRGHFMEWFQRDRYRHQGVPEDFFQDNYSRSVRGVLRGLHYQRCDPQGKLIGVVHGKIYDVIVDLRNESTTFGKWASTVLDDATHQQLYVPPGLAHGFCVLSEFADVLYKCTTPYSPADERTILWNDDQLDIAWPLENPILSDKDRQGLALRDVAP